MCVVCSTGCGGACVRDCVCSIGYDGGCAFVRLAVMV